MRSTTEVIRVAGDICLPYVERGSATGTPVLFLHGLTDSWRSFEEVLAHLPDSVRGIAVTQRGHGDATRPDTGYRSIDFAEDVDRILDALAIDRAVLVGHSSHCFVAERYAVDRPERVLGLVLIGAPATLRDRSDLREVLETLESLTDPIDPLFVRSFVQGTYHRPLPASFVDDMVAESLKVPAFVWREAFAALPEAELTGELSSIGAPVLLVWGDRDSIVSRQDQDALLRRIPGASLLVYEGTGHSPHWEEPARFARDLGLFLETQVRSRNG